MLIVWELCGSCVGVVWELIFLWGKMWGAALFPLLFLCLSTPFLGRMAKAVAAVGVCVGLR